MNFNSSKMTSNDDKDVVDRNFDDQVSKMMVDESDAASELDPIKLANIR